jgi:hypothetical protein
MMVVEQVACMEKLEELPEFWVRNRKGKSYGGELGENISIMLQESLGITYCVLFQILW